MARAIRERFFATARRDFAGIIVLISRNHNEAVTENICEAPQTHLISTSFILTHCGREYKRHLPIKSGLSGPLFLIYDSPATSSRYL